MNTKYIVSLALVSVLAASCKKDEPDTVVVSENGKVVAVKDDAGTNPDKVVVVKDSDLIWPSVESTIRSQVTAANNEDLEGYLSYMHPDSAEFPDARAQAARVFAANDLRTTLESLEAESVSEGEVKARFVQRTEKLSGQAFRNNRITGTYVLRKDGAMWKIFTTRTDKVDYLDPAP